MWTRRISVVIGRHNTTAVASACRQDLLHSNNVGDDEKDGSTDQEFLKDCPGSPELPCSCEDFLVLSRINRNRCLHQKHRERKWINAVIEITGNFWMKNTYIKRQNSSQCGHGYQMTDLRCRIRMATPTRRRDSRQ